MATSGDEYHSLDEQKRILHRILLSEPEGYTNIQRMLDDLKSEYDINGEQLAYKFGYNEFSIFLRSPIMSKYCHVKEAGHKTHYSGVRDSRSDHIVDELQASHEAKRLKTAGKRPNGTMKSNSIELKPRRQVGFIKRNDSDRSVVPANLTTKQIDPEIYCKDQYEKALQTEGGMTRAQLEEKLQQKSQENQQLKVDLCTLKAISERTIYQLQNLIDEKNVELNKSEARNRTLFQSNRNLEAELDQLDLDRLQDLQQLLRKAICRKANTTTFFTEYLDCEEALEEPELKTVTQECPRLSTLQISERSGTGNGLISNEVWNIISDFDVQVSSNGANMVTPNEAPQCQNDSSRDGEPKKNASMQEHIEELTRFNCLLLSYFETRRHWNHLRSRNILKKTELTKITICIASGCAKFESSYGQMYPIGPLSDYLSMLRQSKALRNCETHIAFDPSRFVRNVAETAIAARDKFEKLLQEIHSIAHFWAEGRVVVELQKYPKRAMKVLPLSDVCECLFGQDRSILVCKDVEISLTDDWPFSIVTNSAPSKRLIVKEMLRDFLPGDEQLHCTFLDAIYKKKIPKHVDVQLFLYHKKSTSEFNDELKQRFQLSTGLTFEFKVLSPRRIPNMVDRNMYGTIEIKTSIPQSGQSKFIARITQRSFSLVRKQQKI